MDYDEYDDMVAQIDNLMDALAAEYERGELGEDFPIDQLGFMADDLKSELAERTYTFMIAKDYPNGERAPYIPGSIYYTATAPNELMASDICLDRFFADNPAELELIDAGYCYIAYPHPNP